MALSYPSAKVAPASAPIYTMQERTRPDGLIAALRMRGLDKRAALAAGLAKSTGQPLLIIHSEIGPILGGDVLTRTGELKSLAIATAALVGMTPESAYKIQLEFKTANPALFARHKMGRVSKPLIEYDNLFRDRVRLRIALRDKGILTRAILAHRLSPLPGLQEQIDQGELDRFLRGDVFNREQRTLLSDIAIAVANLAGLDPKVAYEQNLRTANFLDFTTQQVDEVFEPFDEEQKSRPVRFRYKRKTIPLPFPYAKYMRALLREGGATPLQLLEELMEPAFITGREKCGKSCLRMLKKHFKQNFGEPLPIRKRGNVYVWFGEKVTILGGATSDKLPLLVEMLFMNMRPLLKRRRGRAARPANNPKPAETKPVPGK